MKPLPILLAALFVRAVTTFAADETVTYHVIGLFSHDREADLRAVVEDLPGITIASIDFDHAEVAFTYDPEFIFKGVKREEIVKRLDALVRDESNRTFAIEPVIPTPKEQLTQIEILVAGLDCKACCLAAYEAVAKIDGVVQATASFREGRVTALIDPAKTNRAALEEALKKKTVKLVTPAN